MSNYKRIFIQNAPVFLTITTQNRMPFLIENVALLRKSFRQAKTRYKFEIIASVILPDHMHIILHPQNIYDYPKIIFAIKYHFSRNFCPKMDNRTKSKISKKEKGIWQRRYYEHTIRDESDLENCLNYIHFNPVKHDMVSSVKNWEYSSFHKFVKNEQYPENWGTNEDIASIKDLNYE